MYPRLAARLLAALATAGCAPGTVSVDGVDPFGPVGSALLVERTIGDAEPFEYVLLTNRVGYCEDFRVAFAQQVAANRTFDAATEAATTDTERCRAFADQLDRQASIWAGLHEAGHHVLLLGLGAGPEWVGPEDMLTAADGTAYFGLVEYYAGNPYAGASEELFCEGDGTDLGTGTYAERVDTWWLTAGELTLDREAGTVALTDGELHDPDIVQPTGSIEAEATLDACKVAVD